MGDAGWIWLTRGSSRLTALLRPREEGQHVEAAVHPTCLMFHKPHAEHRVLYNGNKVRKPSWKEAKGRREKY